MDALRSFGLTAADLPTAAIHVTRPVERKFLIRRGVTRHAYISFADLIWTHQLLAWAVHDAEFSAPEGLRAFCGRRSRALGQDSEANGLSLSRRFASRVLEGIEGSCLRTATEARGIDSW